MKKFSIFVFALIIFLSSIMLVACDGGSIDPDKPDVPQIPCSHSYSVVERGATCTSGGYTTYRCFLCSDTYEEYESALGHTTNSGTCTRCGQTFEVNVWQTSFYVDEFNNPTDEAYVKNTTAFIGTFSNSATTNSELHARILIDADDVAVKLWEYGWSEVNAYSTTYYDIILLDDNGDKHYTTGTMYKNGERIHFADWTFVTLLQQNQKLKVYIEEDGKYGYNSAYLFEVKNGNFNTVYSNFYNQYC